MTPDRAKAILEDKYGECTAVERALYTLILDLQKRVEALERKRSSKGGR